MLSITCNEYNNVEYEPTYYIYIFYDISKFNMQVFFFMFGR